MPFGLKLILLRVAIFVHILTEPLVKRRPEKNLCHKKTKQNQLPSKFILAVRTYNRSSGREVSHTTGTETEMTDNEWGVKAKMIEY